MHDNTAEEIQRKYDYFCDTFTSRIKKVQVDIEQIKDRRVTNRGIRAIKRDSQVNSGISDTNKGGNNR